MVMRLPIESRIIVTDGMLFVLSEVQVPEKEGDNWIKAKTVFDPERPIHRRPGDPLGAVSSTRRLFVLYEQIVAEQTEAINRTRDAWEAENAPA